MIGGDRPDCGFGTDTAVLEYLMGCDRADMSGRRVMRTDSTLQP